MSDGGLSIDRIPLDWAPLDRAEAVVRDRDRYDPVLVVETVEAASTRIETPCGDGAMVWRCWGRADAPILLLLHGGHGAWSHWILTIPTLAKFYRVLAPDMPGFGGSATLNDNPAADELAATLVAGLDKVAGSGASVIVCGFSFGGVIAGHVAHHLQDRAERLLLVGASGLGLPRAERPPMHRWRDASTADELRDRHRGNLAILMIADPARIDPLAVHLQTVNTARCRTSSRPISRKPVLRDVLGAIDAPLAALYGAKDITALPDVMARAEVFRSFQPDAPFHVIEESGHWVQYEAPDDVVAWIRDMTGGQERAGTD